VIDVLHEVVVTPRRAFPRLPDLRVIERPGWLQIVTPSIKTGGLNEVMYSRLDEHGADAAIDAAIAIYRDLGLKFRWSGAPGNGPEDLGARLVRRGLDESWGRGMACSTDVTIAPSRDDTNIDVVRAETLADYTHVMATGWSADPIALAAMHGHLLADERYHLFVAYSAGEPAAAASYLAFAHSAFLMGGVVLPHYRGRGLYRALVAARLAHARSLGLELAATHARESTSAPILERIGFDTVCRFAMYFG
jgi:GNAT superfamily N-acetyltransferase